jgi:hypothetical protein
MEAETTKRVLTKSRRMIKAIIQSLLPVRMFKTLTEVTKEEYRTLGKDVLLVFTPLLIFWAGATIGLLVFSFVFWSMPDSWYVPFLEPSTKIFDRILVGLGVCWLLASLADDPAGRC